MASFEIPSFSEDASLLRVVLLLRGNRHRKKHGMESFSPMTDISPGAGMSSILLWEGNGIVLHAVMMCLLFKKRCCTCSTRSRANSTQQRIFLLTEFSSFPSRMRWRTPHYLFHDLRQLFSPFLTCNFFAKFDFFWKKKRKKEVRICVFKEFALSILSGNAPVIFFPMTFPLVVKSLFQRH